MGSKVLPYFILTAEKVTDLKELEELEENHPSPEDYKPSPSPPPPSGVSHALSVKVKKGKKKGLIKYKIPVRALRKRSSLNTKMELIKEKLEKSRERLKHKKGTGLLTNGPSDRCVPTVIKLNENSDNSLILDRSISDVSGTKGKRNADGTFPYVYFVVSDNKIGGETGVDNVNSEHDKNKSADKKKRVKIVDDKEEKKDKKEQMAKMQGLARELGLKSVLETKTPDSKQKSLPSVNHIVFPESAFPDNPKSKFGNDLPSTKSHIPGIMHPNPTRVPPSTPATYLSDFKLGDHVMPDVDENVPRKPFLSGPLYAGKAARNLHSCSLQTFELPNIAQEQKRRNLGRLGSSTRFDEFAYPKPLSEQRDRKVSFADQLPVIRGSGFVLSGNEPRDEFGEELPSLGPRAATMGSITLPSEKVDRQAFCQRFLLGENVASARTMRRNGIPLPLPKIDIVSNVYDEMIIKMIQEYLQVSNTPSRQSQLAKELLVQLQKHNENMKEINVPVVKVQRQSDHKAEQESNMKLHKTRTALLSQIGPPPNTADTISNPLTPVVDVEIKPPDIEICETPKVEDVPTDEEGNALPVTEVTFKSKNDETEDKSRDDLPKSAKSGRSTRSRERPPMNSITPVSFQMAPPGLSKEETNISLMSSS